MSDTIKKFRTQHPLKQAADVVAIFVMVAGVLISILMNCVGRSLWVDEAMLAYSFSKRDLLHLSSGVFEWAQSAPLIYLYFTKIITLIFGNTEAVLRGVSVFCFTLTLILTVFVSSRVFRIKYSLQAGAFLANMNFMLQYSNMFKQYISECVWVLLVLLLYKLYHDGKLKWFHFMAASMIFVWGANPACFFIGGVLLFEFIEGVINKDKTKLASCIKIGIGVVVSFGAYYFYWLREVALSSAMQDYWENANFPLIPTSLQDIAMARAMIYEIFITFREARLIMVALVAAGLLIGMIWEKDRYVSVCLLGFIVTLTASYLHMFPVADRLWCFSFPVFTILAFVAVDRMGQGSTRAMVGALALSGALIVSNNGIAVYRFGENVYMDGEEINSAISYVENNIKEGETAYVFHSSIPAVSYKIGYDAAGIGNYTGNIIWGTDTLNKTEAEGDITEVTALDGCFILASHAPAERIDPLLDACRREGFLQVVQSDHDTPLYYYSTTLDNSRYSASLELIDREDEGDTSYVTIRVTNNGNCIINYEGDMVRIGSKERDDIGTNLWGNLMPGAYFDMPLEIKWNNDKEVRLSLEQGGRFWFDELGTEPVIIKK